MVFFFQVRYVSGSPQSTLCTVGSGCGCRQFSSRVGPNCQSRVSSPPGTWDLLYAAAGEVERIRMNQESFGFYNHNRGLLGPPKKPFPVTVPVKNPANLLDVGFYKTNHQHYHEQSLSHQQLQASQVCSEQIHYYLFPLALHLCLLFNSFCFNVTVSASEAATSDEATPRFISLGRTTTTGQGDNWTTSCGSQPNQ